MRAFNFINEQLSPLRKTDTVEVALDYMMVQGVAELPIIDKQQIYNYARMKQLVELDKSTTLENNIPYNPHSIYAREDQHLYDIVPIFNSYDLQVVGVLNAQNEFTGIIDSRKVQKEISNSLTYRGVGSIIVLQLSERDFVPSQIARLVEENGAKMLGLMTYNAESDKLDISIKLNTLNIRNIVATLNRFGYKVTQYYNAEDMNEFTQKDYDSVLKFFDL